MSVVGIAFEFVEVKTGETSSFLNVCLHPCVHIVCVHA